VAYGVLKTKLVLEYSIWAPPWVAVWESHSRRLRQPGMQGGRTSGVGGSGDATSFPCLVQDLVGEVARMFTLGLV